MSHSSDEETDFQAVNATNYQRIQNKVSKISYADGVSDGRDQVFQASFDQGYADGMRTGFELAKLRAFYETLTPADMENADLSKEGSEYLELKLAAATDKTHFKYLEHQTEALSIVSERQKAYIDNLMKQCAIALPKTTILFPN